MEGREGKEGWEGRERREGREEREGKTEGALFSKTALGHVTNRSSQINVLK